MGAPPEEYPRTHVSDIKTSLLWTLCLVCDLFKTVHTYNCSLVMNMQPSQTTACGATNKLCSLVECKVVLA